MKGGEDMKQALIIKVNSGTVEIIRTPFERGSLDFYYKELECDCIDIVAAYGLTADADIIVDDEGLCKEKPVLNPYASIAYGWTSHGQPIVGNAIICKPHNTPDGVEETGFEEDELDKLLDEILRKFSEVYTLWLSQ